MKKLYLAALLVFCLPGGAFGRYSGGTGEVGDPYRIGTAADINDISNHTEDLSAHFVMIADVNMADLAFTMAVIAPDTSTAYNFQGTKFTGVFDGNDHKISNLTIDTEGVSNSYLGLFGWSDGEVRNLGVEYVNVIGGDDSKYLGCLCGVSYNGAIDNCYATGSIIAGNIYSGGLCGGNYGGTITNCYATSAVSVNYYLGGLCGKNSGGGTITNCYATGAVSGDIGLGGLCGTNDDDSAITNCYATGSVIGGDVVGGLCGDNDGTITSCYAKGAISGRLHLGGLCGKNFNGMITNCYATGAVSGDGVSAFVGGLCGTNQGLIDTEGSGPITNCYSTGAVSGSGFIGGLCGDNMFGTITNCFWDINSSGLTSSYDGTGLTTIAMQNANTFINAGWDFLNMWWINDGRDYPKLDWQPYGDLNNDSWVNLYDVAVMSMTWQANDGDANYNSVCELSGDTTVSVADLLELTGMWLAGPSY